MDYFEHFMQIFESRMAAAAANSVVNALKRRFSTQSRKSIRSNITTNTQIGSDGTPSADRTPHPTLGQAHKSSRAKNNKNVVDIESAKALTLTEKQSLARKVVKPRKPRKTADIDDAYSLASETMRGLRRLEEQLHDQQARIDWVASRAVAIANADDEGDNAREIPDDWLKRFFQYVADIDETRILELLARGLADAAVRGRTILSPKALDTLRFFEMDSFRNFHFCVNQLCFFDVVPDSFLENRAAINNIKIDVNLMIELGLIKESRKKHFSIRLSELVFYFSFDVAVYTEFKVYELTYVGKSIAKLMDKRIGELRDALASNLNLPEIPLLQDAIGMESGHVVSLARLFISQIADIQNIDVKISEILNSKSVDLIKFKRISQKDEFNILRDKNNYVKNKYIGSKLFYFIEQFYDFDQNQLPYMYETE